MIRRLDPALHLRRLGRVRLEALDETLLLGEHGLLAREGGLLVGLANGALALVEVVVARVRDDFAAVDFRDSRNNPVHELAVVRRHEKGAGERLQKLLQPDDRFNIEVIGGLIH